MATILNIMLSRSLGGIEQSFLDYSLCLKDQKYNVINIVSLGSKVNIESSYKLLNLGIWDYISILQLKLIILKHRPDIIIAHGNRAINFADKAKITGVKLVGISHNYNLKHIKKCDYIFALTNHLMNYISSQNFPLDKIKLIPNMIQLTSTKESESDFHHPVIIGTMGRFVKKKGFDNFLHALSLLKAKGMSFKARIGGSGEEKSYLESLCLELGLNKDVEFIGWVYDKKSFFDNIDIFCLPSLHEPFGIILLEAMNYRKVIVSTASEGPSEIITNMENGILCSIGDPAKMAEAFEHLIQNQSLSKLLVENAYLNLKQNYDMKVAGKILHKSIEQILHGF